MPAILGWLDSQVSNDEHFLVEPPTPAPRGHETKGPALTPAPGKPWTIGNVLGAVRLMRWQTYYGLVAQTGLFRDSARPKTHDQWMMRHHLYERWTEIANG